MTFTLLSSWLAITLIAGIITGGLGCVIGGSDDDGFAVAWLISTVMLGVCVAYIMYSKGIIS